MSRSNLSKLKMQVVKIMKLIDKTEVRIEKMRSQNEIFRNTLLTLRAQIETKEALENAISTGGTQAGA